MARRATQPKVARYYETNAAHLTDELQKLDLLIQRRFIQLRLQRDTEQGMSATKGLYISHEEADALLHQGVSSDLMIPEVTTIDHQIEALQNRPDHRRTIQGGRPG